MKTHKFDKPVRIELPVGILRDDVVWVAEVTSVVRYNNYGRMITTAVCSVVGTAKDGLEYLRQFELRDVAASMRVADYLSSVTHMPAWAVVNPDAAYGSRGRGFAVAKRKEGETV
jgi:hypothetical protein